MSSNEHYSGQKFRMGPHVFSEEHGWNSNSSGDVQSEHTKEIANMSSVNTISENQTIIELYEKGPTESTFDMNTRTPSNGRVDRYGFILEEEATDYRMSILGYPGWTSRENIGE
jgi:hypothetical protein